MTVSANLAANAYANALKVGDSFVNDGKATGQGRCTMLGNLPRWCRGRSRLLLKKGRWLKHSRRKCGSGKGNLVDLVTTIAETEIAVETLVTTRDRVISAYRDIMNMPI